MNRRELLGKLAPAGAITLVMGAVVGERAYARWELKERLVHDAMPRVTAKSHTEIIDLPARGKEAIRTWFHERCLKSATFVREVYSDEFSATLRSCHSEEQKQSYLWLAFYQTVMTETETLSQIHAVAEDIGTELDRNWKDLCLELSNRWGLLAKPSTHALTSNGLVDQTESTIRIQLSDGLKHLHSIGDRPTLGETVGKLGCSAILLLRLRSFGTAGMVIAVPVFAITAFCALWDYVLSRLNTRQGEYQLAISERIADLGNRLAADLETELRERIADLHRWQETSLLKAAEVTAAGAVTIF